MPQRPPDYGPTQLQNSHKTGPLTRCRAKARGSAPERSRRQPATRGERENRSVISKGLRSAAIGTDEDANGGPPDGGNPQIEGVELQGAEATKYRAIIARGNFLSIDRPDIHYAVKEASRCTAKPTVNDWAKLERLAKYIARRPRAVTRHP